MAKFIYHSNQIAARLLEELPKDFDSVRRYCAKKQFDFAGWKVARVIGKIVFVQRNFPGDHGHELSHMLELFHALEIAVTEAGEYPSTVINHDAHTVWH